MCVDDSADFREGAIERKMGRGVGRGAESAFDHVAVEVDHYHVFSLHFIVVHTAGFDYDEFCLRIYAGDIAPCVDDKTVFHEVKIGPEYFFF